MTTDNTNTQNIIYNPLWCVIHNVTKTHKQLFLKQNFIITHNFTIFSKLGCFATVSIHVGDLLSHVKVNQDMEWHAARETVSWMNMADYLRKQSVTMGWRVDHSICSLRAQRGIKNQPRSAELPISPPSINPTPPGVTTSQQNQPRRHTEQLQFTQWHGAGAHMKLTNSDGPSATGYWNDLEYVFAIFMLALYRPSVTLLYTSILEKQPHTI